MVIEEYSQLINAIAHRVIRKVSTDNIRKQMQIDARTNNALIVENKQFIEQQELEGSNDSKVVNNFTVLLEVAADYRHKNEEKFNQNFFKNVGICKMINKDSTFELLLQI